MPHPTRPHRWTSPTSKAGPGTKEAAMPDEYALWLEASGEVTTAQPDTDDSAEPEPEESER
ncbi:hypothetical protein GCM10009837_07540 [Streptomyces durmitorensis]